MLKSRSFTLSAIAAMAAAGCVLLLRSPTSVLAKAELAAQDSLAVHGRQVERNDKLIFLGIDNDSVSLNAETDLRALFGVEDLASPEGRALSLMSKRWPWSREAYAMILDRLLASGAKAVVFDLLFPTAGDGDDELASSLRAHADQVVIGSNFEFTSDDSGHLRASLTSPSPTVLPATAGQDERVGVVNFWPDADGAIRSARFRISLAALAGATAKAESPDLSLVTRALIKLGRADLVPADALDHPFRYTAGSGIGFPVHSVFEIFAPDYWAHNYGSGELFRGATVIVGAAGNWQHDEHPTPFGVMPGPEIQLNVMNALLHRELLNPSSFLRDLLVLVAAGAGAVTVASLRPLYRFGLLALMGITLFAAHWLFNHGGYLMPIVSPLAVIAVTGLAALVYDLIAASAERLRLHLRMREQQVARDALAAANEQLEARVSERTVALTEANSRLSSLLEEKDVLLKEIHHRVKNNMQVISSLLNLQAQHIEDPAALELFAESRNRVRSMALIHEKLYQSSDLAKIDLGGYLKTLAQGLSSSYASKVRGVSISTESEDVQLGIDAAVPCGLIVNELVTNSFKYAFPNGKAGQILIAMSRPTEGRLQLTVSDNGVGFPKGTDFRETESLGLQLVNTLTEQLGGEVEMRNGVGTTFEISFAEPV